MKTIRQAIMRVSLQMLSEFVDAANMVNERPYSVDYYLKTPEMLHKLLMLPRNATIVAVSEHAFFVTNQIGVRVKCPDFVETQEGESLPEVRASYVQYSRNNVKYVANFYCWEGTALCAGFGPEPHVVQS